MKRTVFRMVATMAMASAAVTSVGQAPKRAAEPPSWKLLGAIRGAEVIDVGVAEGAITVRTRSDESWSTSDGGATWKPSSPPVAASRRVSRPDGILFDVDGGAVRISRDGGASWHLTSLTSGASTIGITTSGNLIFVGGPAGLRRSTDVGSSWVPLGAGLPSREIRAVAVTGRGFIVVGTPVGLFRSVDDGENFQACDTPIRSPNVRLLALGSADALLAATDVSLLRSGDEGTTWKPILVDGSGLVVDALALGADGTAAVAAGGALFASSDGGESFRRVPLTWSAGPIVALRIAGGSIEASTKKNGVYRSADGGVSWSPVLGAEPFVLDQSNATATGGLTCRLEGDSAFACSRDRGATWTSAAVPEGGVTRVVVTPKGTVLASGKTGVHRSTDAGATWTTPLASPLAFTALLVLPGGEILATRPGGVWWSRDDGVTFATANRGLPDLFVGGAAVRDDGSAIVGTRGGEIFGASSH